MGSDDRHIMDKVAVIILAGGQGKRLFPLTQYRCKPAVSFGGRYRLIDIPLSHCINSGLKRVFLLSQYLSSSLHEHVFSAFSNNLFFPGHLTLLSPEETPTKTTWAKGTADAIRQNLATILEGPSDYFLILSGDQVYNMDLTEMYHLAEKEKADLVIASIPVKETEAKRMGLLKVEKGFHVKEFFEKPQDPELLKKFQLSKEFLKTNHLSDSSHPQYLGSMGIYLFKRQALIDLLKEEGDDFGRHLLPKQIHKGKMSAYLFHGFWEDIGTIRSYYDANLSLLCQKDCFNCYDEANPIITSIHHLPSAMIQETTIHGSLISQGSIVEAKEITRSIIGLRSRIGKGTVVKDSLVLGNPSYTPLQHAYPHTLKSFGIGENCLIEKAIIDEHTLIGNNVTLTNKGKLTNYDGDGIYIRDGIIIVTAGTQLPNNFTF